VLPYNLKAETLFERDSCVKNFTAAPPGTKFQDRNIKLKSNAKSALSF